jgi:diadenosine tetraphosphatase ApaH/serine/threonine PP2A family protein phosphatase
LFQPKETRDVNGWKEHYGDRSFLYQCERRFGEELGFEVWEAINSAFDRLPLAATIDDEIFCIHGGFPRKPGEVPVSHAGLSRLELLDRVPKVITINPPDPRADPHLQQMASECIWSDPAHAEQELGLDETGFGSSLRGGGTVCFGQLAIRAFLQETGCSFIIRAHEAHAHGVSLSKSATVFTVFSTSKDHHQGKHASCGCMLVDTDKIQIINRSPSYRNRYVHRRDSVSLMGLGHAEIQRRQELGLVIEADDNDDDDYNNYDDDDDEDLELQDSVIQEEEQEEEEDDDDDDLRLGGGGGYSAGTTAIINEEL